MASLLPGFECDVYISYRLKDNKGDAWVTRFVESLKAELETSYKEEVSIYFDQNPHDGLLETHDVTASLADKVKSLVFIPIISRTYCDTNSFAWQNEFLIFKKLANSDQFGLKIKLANGNVASRILPIKINEPDKEDRQLIESELGGVLRAIEFIYREPGVSRPLEPEDDETRNQNKTRYRNQVNKTANAVTEIISGIKDGSRPKTDSSPEIPVPHVQTKPASKRQRNIVITCVALLILLPAAYLLLSRAQDPVRPFQKSIAVLPFVNMSNDSTQEPLSDGMTEELITQLSKISKLKVIGRTSSFSFKGKSIDLREIGKALGVETVLEGSVQKSGSHLRITAQLINTQDGSHIWAEKYDEKEGDIFKIMDNISNAVVGALKLQMFSDDETLSHRPPNLEAYKLYLKGRYYYFHTDPRATEAFFAALKIDPNYAKALAGIAKNSVAQGVGPLPASVDTVPRSSMVEFAKAYAQRSIAIDPTDPEAIGALATSDFMAEYNYTEAEKEVQRGLQADPRNIDLLITLSQINLVTGRRQEAERVATDLVEIDPKNPYNYITLARSLWAQRKFAEAEKELTSALELSPENFIVPYILGLISLEKGNAQEALNRFAIPTTKDPDLMNRIASSMPYFALGQKGKSDEILRWAETGYGSEYPGLIAFCHAFRKENDLAFAWIEKAIDLRDARLIIDPHFFSEGLRKDPRYVDVRKRLNLPLQIEN